MKKGLFISFEGPDGSGKSTQIEYLKDYLDNQGMDCVFTREPGGTAIGEKLREIILDKENNEMCDMAEMLLYASSRAQHVAEKIEPALDAGKIVVCDRFVDSSIAYQGYGRKMGEVVEIINSYAVMGCMPDLTFLMEVDPKVGKSRIKNAERDRLERERLQFHQRVYKGYIEMAEKEPERIIPIDASQTREEIRDVILHHVERFLKEKGILL